MILELTPTSALLRTSATPLVLAVAGRLEGRRRWSPAGLHFEPTGHNLDAVRRLDPEEPAATPEAEAFEPARATYVSKTEPFPHQVEALDRMRDRFALFMEQGCVDRDTEYLSPTGWRKISEYEDGQMVAEYRLDGTAAFVEPIAYVVKDCAEMAHFKTKYGCDQMLSLDHRMLLALKVAPSKKKCRQGWFDPVAAVDGTHLVETSPARMFERFEGLGDLQWRNNRVPSTFSMDGQELEISDAALRLQVAFIADGSYGSRAFDSPPRWWKKGTVRIKKDRKKFRLYQLLRETGIPFTTKAAPEGFTVFSFIPPIPTKHFVDSFWWSASARQKAIIAEESLKWDGDGKNFFSVRKEDADYVNFCFASTGRRSRVLRNNELYSVVQSPEPIGLGVPEIVPTVDGKMYCFSVPSTYLVFRRNGCVFVSGNTGKSKVAIDRAGTLWAANRIDAVLVVSKKGAHRQWIEEQFPTHYGSDLLDAAFWPLKRLPEGLLVKDGRLKVFAINYDGAKAEKGKRAALDFVTAHRGRIFVVADESQEIKNAASARWKALDEIRRAAATPFRALLTGTPIAKDLTDEWAQMKWLDESILGIKYVTTFRARFCRMGGFEGREVVGHVNVDEFRRLTDPASFRVTQEDIGLLPPAFEEWAFDLDPRQVAAMRALKNELLAELESGAEITAANVAVATSKMQQISNGFVLDGGGGVHLLVEPAKNPRLAALEEYLDAHDGRKVVIWAKFRQDIALVAERLERMGRSFVEYHGGTSDKARAANVASFLAPGGADVFLSNPQSGGTGLNLQGGGARAALYYSNGHNAIDRWQSQFRIQRIGTKGLVTYTDLVANRSVDRAILANLRKKKSISDLGIGEYRSILEALP